MNRRATLATGALGTILTLGGAGCTSTPQPTQQPDQPVRHRGSLGGLYDHDDAPATGPRREIRSSGQASKVRVLYGSHEWGVNYLLEGPKDAAGNDRDGVDRFGVALANTGLDQINGVPVAGWLVRDGRRIYHEGFWDPFWGENPDGTPRARPGWYSPTTWAVAVPRLVTFPLRRGFERFVDWAYRCGDCNGCKKAAGGQNNE